MEVAGFVDVLKTLSEETTDEEVKAAIDELVQKLDGKEFVTGFDEFKVLDADKAEKNADGKYEVEISVPSITDTMENIQLVVYKKMQRNGRSLIRSALTKRTKLLKLH